MPLRLLVTVLELTLLECLFALVSVAFRPAHLVAPACTSSLPLDLRSWLDQSIS
jgi:hypothetical protein